MDWTQIRIPTPLLKEIQEAINKHPSQGYTNEHEFIRAALRDKIAEVKKKANNPNPKSSKETPKDG